MDKLANDINKAIVDALNSDGNAKKGVLNAIFKNVYEEHTKALKHQIQVQTKYGALYYETPYHGVSTLKSCVYSCGCTHGKELELRYQDDRNEPKKS